MLRDHPHDPESSTGSTEPMPALSLAEHPGRRPPAIPSFFVHEPFGVQRTSGLRVGVIADGTTRGGPNGLAEGRRRVVECAEHCAERGDVELLGAFLLSPQNVTRRKKPFFAALHAEFLRLLEEVESGRALAGIRVEVHGRLDRLRKKGGPAARLAHVMDLLGEATRSRQTPRLRLLLCVDYGEDSPLDLALDVLIRTGMEEPSVLRLSGLRVHGYTRCIPSTRLWRDFTPADLDHALALAGQGLRIEHAAGYSAGFVERLLPALSRARLSTPIRLVLPLAAPEEALASLGRSAAEPCAVGVTAMLGAAGRLRRFGPRGAPVQLRLVGPRSRPWAQRDEPVAWIAPGQPSPVFRLLDRRAGDANVHACEPTPEGVVEGLCRALRFHAAHPPLHGAPRAAGRDEPASAGRIEELVRHASARMDAPAESIARSLPGGESKDPCLTAEVFAAKCLSEARSTGLVSGEVDWTRQAFGYALTAFGIAFRPSPSPAAWEPAARALARVMLALASSDEEISDRVFPGERGVARRTRLAASAGYLIAALRGEPREPPAVPGAATLVSIARTWEGFFAEHAPAAHPAILSGVRRAAEDLYRANLAELSRTSPLFASLSRTPAGPDAEAALQRLDASAPPPVARRIRDLLRTAAGEPPQSAAWRELRLLCRLSHVAPSIGAGCALLAMAATEPARAVPEGGAAALLRATPLIDHYFRLANDLSFEDATRGDRDDKPSAFSYLIPPGLAGKARERASADALRTCRAAADWLDAEARAAVAELAGRWPLAASWLQRGTHVGRRAYEIGHYDRLSRSAWAGIVREASCGV